MTPPGSQLGGAAHVSPRVCSCGNGLQGAIPSGTYRDGNRIVGIGVQCPACKSDSLIPINDASPEMIRKARVADAMRARIGQS